MPINIRALVPLEKLHTPLMQLGESLRLHEVDPCAVAMLTASNADKGIPGVMLDVTWTLVFASTLFAATAVIGVRPLSVADWLIPVMTTVCCGPTARAEVNCAGPGVGMEGPPPPPPPAQLTSEANSTPAAIFFCIVERLQPVFLIRNFGPVHPGNRSMPGALRQPERDPGADLIGGVLIAPLGKVDQVERGAAHLIGGEGQRRDEGLAVVIGVAPQQRRRPSQAQPLARRPPRAAAGRPRPGGRRIPVEAGLRPG